MCKEEKITINNNQMIGQASLLSAVLAHVPSGDPIVLEGSAIDGLISVLDHYAEVMVLMAS